MNPQQKGPTQTADIIPSEPGKCNPWYTFPPTREIGKGGRWLLSLDPSLDVNEGLLQNLDEWITREGTVLQPRFPAPVGMRMHTHYRLVGGIFGTLAQAKGGQVPASSPVYTLYYFRAYDPETRELILCIEGLGVGLGARPFADGIDVIYYIAQENYPVEYVEQEFPLRIAQYAMRPDSGGLGCIGADAASFGMCAYCARRQISGPAWRTRSSRRMASQGGGPGVQAEFS